MPKTTGTELNKERLQQKLQKTIAKNPGTNYYPPATKGGVPQTVIGPAKPITKTKEKKKENQGTDNNSPKLLPATRQRQTKTTFL